MRWLAIFLITIFLSFLGSFWGKPESQKEIPLPIGNPAVASLLKRSCANCHSEQTVWPWYSNFFPVSLFLYNHVQEGREELNLSQWPSLSPAQRRKKIEEIGEEVEEGEMPPQSYLMLHREAFLSEADKKLLKNWLEEEDKQNETH